MTGKSSNKLVDSALCIRSEIFFLARANLTQFLIPLELLEWVRVNLMDCSMGMSTSNRPYTLCEVQAHNISKDKLTSFKEDQQRTLQLILV